MLKGILFSLLTSHLEGFVESERVNLLQDSLESNKRLLENLVPVVFCEVADDRNKHGEGLVLVSLKNVKEVVILEEAHGSIRNLKMDSTDAFNDSLEEFEDEMVNLVNFANFKDLL